VPPGQPEFTEGLGVPRPLVDEGEGLFEQLFSILLRKRKELRADLCHEASRAKTSLESTSMAAQT